MKMSTYYQRAVLVFTVAVGITAVTSTRRENVSAYGIWSHESNLVLLAQVYPCSAEELPPPGAAQLFISKDGGASWEKSGPQFDGSEFEYVYEKDARLWIVGEHIAEGPASEPFVLVPNEGSLTWSRHLIYDGYSEVQGIAVSENNTFIAWIRHIKLSSDDWDGGLYVHESSDGGRRWRVVGRAKKAYEGGSNGFKKIVRQTSLWRVIDLEGGGSAVEHRVNDRSAWKLVSAFPYEACRP